MRRFLSTLPGKFVCHTVAAALFMPTLTLMSVTRAEAQIQTLPSWAVVDFVNKSKKGGQNIGNMAADATASELSKTGRYDVIARETVQRAVETLQLQTPVTDQTSLSRLAQEVQAAELITGEVVDWRIRPAAGGKQADVLIRVLVVNVASGIPINGAAVTGRSAVRPGDVADEVLLAEAFSNAALNAVQDIVRRALPRATVLNTFPDSAVINQGTRSGFQNGQRVIILRGPLQVATGRIFDVDYDSARVRLEKTELGLRPGDKVQVVFEVPEVATSIGRDGEPVTRRRYAKRDTGGFVQILGVVLLATLLLGGRNAARNDVVQGVRSEATFSEFAAGPGVKVTWTTDVFVRGNQQKEQYQIWRNDVPSSPVLVVDGINNSFIDDTNTRSLEFVNLPTTTFDCLPAPAGIGVTDVPGITPGRPYSYSVELVYSIDARDFPTGGTGRCFFQSERAGARGLATPLNRPELLSPAQSANVNTPIPFTFDSVITATFPFIAEYALQLSSSPSFARNQTETIGPVTSNSTGVISIGIVDTFNGRISAVRNASTVWWRIGARNRSDNPGPVKDSNGQRYIWSLPRSFNRPGPPPPPP